MKQIIPINLTDGVSRTIYAHYMKAGCHDFDPTSSVPHTAILEIEIMEETRPIQVAQIYDKRGNPMNGRVYSPDGIAGSGGNTDQFVKEASIRQDSIKFKLLPNGNIRGYDDSTADKRGVSELQIINPDNECPTITTAHEPKVLIHYRIRKLTERECFRLMGVDDADIDKIDAYRIRKTLKNGKVKEKPISKSAKYKMAGNSIVVDVLYHIFHQMFIAEPPKQKPKQLTLFDL